MVMVKTFDPLAPTVSRNGPVVSFGVFGLGVGSEPLAAPGPAHAPTLPLPGRPHARSGTASHSFRSTLFKSYHAGKLCPRRLSECLVVFAAAPRIHAGLGPRHPGAGDLLP